MGRKRILATILTVSVSLCLWAQEAETGRFTTLADTILPINEVVVYGFKEATPNQQIGRQAIIGLPSTSVAEALQYLAGVQIKDYGGLGGQKTINVRSLGSQHVGVYLDGVRITNAQNGTVDLGKYSLTTLEAVSLFNANKSEMLMAASEYASASTLYLQTHRPDSSSLMVGYSYGSYNTHKANATCTFVGKQRLSQLRGFVDAAFVKADGNYPFSYHTAYEDTTGTRQNGDIRALRVEGALFYKGWQWHTYYYDAERGLPGGIVRRLSNAYTDMGRESDRNFFSQLSNQQRFGNYGLRGIVKYTNDHLHYRSDYPENIYVHYNNRYHQQDVYGAVAGSYQQGDWSLSGSTDLRFSDLQSDVKQLSYLYRTDSKTSLAAFYTHNGLKLNANMLYTRISDHTQGETASSDKLTWSALASYNLGNLLLRTFYKEVFRAPTLNDLYYTQVGNRNLRPEQTQQFDMGAAYKLTGEICLDLQADWYYNRVTDRIVCLPLKGSYQWSMLNYGRTRCMGIDLSAHTRWRYHSLLVSATWQDDRNRTDRNDAAYNDRVAYTPEWSASAVYSFHYKRYTASLSHLFVGQRYWTTENSLEEPLDAYHCTDIKVGYQWHHLALEAECQDLFDVRYELIQRWPMPGRRFAVTMKYTL